jgi:N-acetylglutamate synthase-like GNAT family acetyltransferase
MCNNMLAVTLDTSCALNFLGHDTEADDALIDLVAAAMDGRLDLRVTEQAFEEVGHTSEETMREQRLSRLRTFGRVKLDAHQVGERDELSERLKAAVFPASQVGSRTDGHNRRDCLQLATHALVGRDVFCTLDTKLLKRAESARDLGVNVLSPTELLELIKDRKTPEQLPGASSLAVRDADIDKDEGAVRSVLAPLANDYPDFSGWLNSSLKKARAGQVRVRVGLADKQVGAVALSTRKDDRVVKLSAFYVTEDARAAGLGQHLLWSELRTWAISGVEKVYVTVSSRHAELIGFFREFGFMVEGISARRYQNDTAEIVLGKHLVRRVIDDHGLGSFTDEIASYVFSAPASVATAGETWALPPASTHPTFAWSGGGASLELVALADGVAERRWGLLELERTFHPVRFSLQTRKALLVPIQPQWAGAMLEYTGQQPSLFDPPSEKLILRSDNAYYCYPRSLNVAQPGTPILFYVSGGTGLVGEARIINAAVGGPEELFARFGGLGIYEINQIRDHIGKTGKHLGEALALRFGSYVPFPSPVNIDQMRTALKRNVHPQTLTSILSEEFELLRRTGGLEW